LTGKASPVDAAFAEPGRYMSWPLSNVRRFTEGRPELQSTLQRLVSQDLAGKVERLSST